MSFPVTLSPSPVEEAGRHIDWNKFGKLELSGKEKSLLRSAEDNVMDYTLADQQDATTYVFVLLKVLDNVMFEERFSSKRVSKLSLDLVITHTEALQLLDDDKNGVVAHYAVSKICEVIQCLKTRSSNSSKVSMASTFYPSGILVENWRPLLKILVGGVSDVFAQRGAAFALACILVEGCTLQNQGKLFSPVSSMIESLVSWMASRLQSSAKKSLSVVTPSLTVLIVSGEARKMFNKAGGVGYLSRHLREQHQSYSNNVASVQQLYELSYCLWLMSFDCETDENIRSHFHRDGAVSALVGLVASAPREKVVRMALSSLRNMALCDTNGKTSITPFTKKKIATEQSFLMEMVGCGLVKHIDRLKERTVTDPDLLEDINLLHKLLHESYREMTTWDVYKSEVESGYLQWGVLHTEKFFKENAKMMEGSDGNFSIVKTLIHLAMGDDEEMASIACFDLGEFVRNYPNGRAIAKRLRAQDVVISLIEHENPDLQRQALNCVSKMLVKNWQSVK